MADRHEPVAANGRFGSAHWRRRPAGAEVPSTAIPARCRPGRARADQVVTAGQHRPRGAAPPGIGDFTRAVVAMGPHRASILTTSLLVEPGVDDICQGDQPTARQHPERVSPRRLSPRSSTCAVSGSRTCSPAGCSTTSRSTGLRRR
ncbi:hypothetical protein HBB16_10445 [Pseudonocardia sp. MCCB 268]|nr:hypothetical protein [Pseudonocardia cytotoxica]